MIYKFLVGRNAEYGFGTGSEDSLVTLFNCVDLLAIGFHSYPGEIDIEYQLGTDWNKVWVQIISVYSYSQ